MLRQCQFNLPHWLLPLGRGKIAQMEERTVFYWSEMPETSSEKVEKVRRPMGKTVEEAVVRRSSRTIL